MSSDIFGNGLFGDVFRPKSNALAGQSLRIELGNPAHAEAVVVDPANKASISDNITMVFSLWRDGALLVDARPMLVQPKNPQSDVSVFSCVITGAELSQHGQYQWEIVSTGSDYGNAISTDSGSFSL
jgi:hypothetical protein